MTPAEHPEDEKFVQQQLVEAYQKELQKSRKEKPLPPQSAPVDTQTQSLADKISTSVAQVRDSLAATAESIETSLKNQFAQWCEIKEMVDQERQVIKEIYQIDVPGDSLAAIVKLRQERRAHMEQALFQAKQEFEHSVERQKTEMTLKEEAFEERCRAQEAEFLSKCQDWEEEMMTRQEAFLALEEELKRKKQQQEALWISRSEELDSAYQARADQLEEEYQLKVQRVERELDDNQLKMEQEWVLRQQRWEQEIRSHQDALHKLQEQLKEKGDEISRVNTKVLDLVSRKDISERVMTNTMPTGQSAPLSGGGRIVRPIKMGTVRRTNG